MPEQPLFFIKADTVDQLLERVEGVVGPNTMAMWVSHRYPTIIETRIKNKELPRWASEEELRQFYHRILNDEQRQLTRLVVENQGRINRNIALKELGFETMKLGGVFSGIVNNAHSRDRISPIKRIKDSKTGERFYSVSRQEYLAWLEHIMQDEKKGNEEYKGYLRRISGEQE